MMARNGPGFSIDVERAVHLMKIRLWGRWNTETGEEYLREFQQKLSTVFGNHDEGWSVLLDLSGYTMPPQEVQSYIEQGFIHLRELAVNRQAILLNGPILHLPGQGSPQAATPVSSYFQSEDEAIEWLMGE
ncbi:MAG: hypothetical protein GY801_06560 [bacterium]|nr:hypothetical protein [bacterium]